MKKVVLGAAMLLAGVISCALLLAIPVVTGSINGNITAWQLMSQLGLAPAFYVFAAIAIVGIVVAMIGIIEKQSKN